ncbi:MAG: hypothetical protein AMXMBFR7_25500 [Planctomycetota bacterium]
MPDTEVFALSSGSLDLTQARDPAVYEWARRCPDQFAALVEDVMRPSPLSAVLPSLLVLHPIDADTARSELEELLHG